MLKALEYPVEVSDIVETRLKGDLTDAEVFFDKPACRITHADIVEVVHKCLVRTLLDEPVKGYRTHAGNVRHIVQRNFLVEVLLYVFVHQLHFVIILKSVVVHRKG